MALTDQQKTDARRFAGYPNFGDVPPDDQHDLAWGMVGPFNTYRSLVNRLATLTDSEEAVVVSYLTTLTTLEAAIPAAADNLDTDSASVWVHNKTEIADRMRLFDNWRRRMCAFLGIPPGPGLGIAGMATIVRG